MRDAKETHDEEDRDEGIGDVFRVSIPSAELGEGAAGFEGSGWLPL